MIQAHHLKSNADALLATAPALVLAAQTMLNQAIMGVHGRRVVGQGEEFWEYRPMVPGDAVGQIDWRRSARGETLYARQNEWEIAQPIFLFCDQSQAMGFASQKNAPSKRDRARLLAMALSMGIVRAGDRAGLVSPYVQAASSASHITLLSKRLTENGTHTYGTLRLDAVSPRARIVILSDFLMSDDAFAEQFEQLARNLGPIWVVQILDPAEKEFPFSGRVRFQGPTQSGTSADHETNDAADLRDAYQQRLMRREKLLRARAEGSGGGFLQYVTSDELVLALVWLFETMAHARKKGRIR